MTADDYLAAEAAKREAILTKVLEPFEMEGGFTQEDMNLLTATRLNTTLNILALPQRILDLDEKNKSLRAIRSILSQPMTAENFTRLGDQLSRYRDITTKLREHDFPLGNEIYSDGIDRLISEWKKFGSKNR